MEMTVLFWLAAVTLAAWVIGGGEVALGSRRIGYLRDLPPTAGIAPSATIVVAARNEEAKVREGVESLLRLEDVRTEVIVADDRSDDRTAEILDEVAARDPSLRVIHITELPDGWLGKTHAMHVAAAAAGSDWLLFTDADVVMAPRAVSKAVRYATREEVDHLAVAPELQIPSLGGDLFAGLFVLIFARFATPWRVRDPASRAHIGVGAFNLIRREVYVAVGGHEPVRMRPDDDLKLGKLIKQAGFRQDVLYGTGEVKVEWYSSLSEAVTGLEKNAFAGAGYSVTRVVAACAALLLFGLWPWIAVVTAEGPVRLLNLASVLVMAGLYVSSTRSSGARPWLAIAMPLAICIFCFTVARSAALAVVRGAIRWRGTSYPLEELRRFDV